MVEPKLEVPDRSSDEALPAPATYERLLLVGGSTANGLGMRELPFGHRYRNPSGSAPAILDLTGSGRILSELEADLGRIRQFEPDLALICAGMSERLVHPARSFQDLLERFAPSGWHGVAGLQPRAYISRSPGRRWRHRVVGWIKLRIKKWALAVGHSQRMSLTEVESRLRGLIRELETMGTTVVLLGTWTIDAKLFPRSDAAFVELDASLRSLSEESDVVSYLELSSVLLPWTDYLADHCHWNATGHAKVAAAVESHLKRPRPVASAP